MPQLALAAQAFTTAGTAASISAATTVAAKATLMTTLKSVAMNVLTNVAISAAMSVLQPQVGAAGRPFEFVIDPDGPIPFAAGRIGVAGSVIHRDTFGPDLMFYGIPAVLSGAGPITAIESVKADDYLMAFDANGGATTEPYRQEFYFRSVLGEQPAPLALSTPAGLKNGATLPGWGPAHKLSGKAAFLMVMAENSKGSAFPTGEVKPLVTLRGLKVYDPRQDSTYPGGTGPQRLGDPSTWTYSDNPILWALKWCLGLWEGPNGKGAPQVDFQVGGIGAKPSGIDFPAFVAAANVSDANEWTVAAYPNTDDDKSQVLDAFLQAGGCVYAQRAGKISCIQRAAPRASVVTISAADTAGPLEIDTAASRIDRINTLRPRFWSEAHRWQMTALDGEITAQAYRDEDGAARTRGLDFPFVSNAKQCGQLAALQIANTREGIAGVIPLKPHMQRIRPGDAFTITEPGFVLNGVKCLCLNTDYDPATGVVRVSFVSETDAKYPFAMGQSSTAPVPPVLTPVDPAYVSPPLPEEWVITPRPPSGGSLLPGFDLSGAVGNSTATAIEVEYWEVPAVVDPNDAPPEDAFWKSAGTWPPTASTIPIDVQADRYYWIGLTYIRAQNYSARTVTGPYLAGQLIAGDVSPVAPTIIGLQDQITTAFGDIFDVSGLLADARADIDAQGVEIAAARGGQPNLNSRIVQVNQARIDGDEANAQAISLVQARTANTEADIIDIENAQANDRTATAQAIQQVTAQVAGAALNKNSTYAIWPLGQSTPDNIGSFGSGLTVSRGVGKVSPNAITLEAAAGSSNNGVEVAWTASNWNGRMPVVAGAPAYWIIDYKIEIGTGGLNGPMLRFLLTNAATGTSLSNTIQKPLSELHTSTGDGQIIEGAYFFRCDLPSGSPAASARLALFTRAGAVANLNRIIAHKLAVRPATSAEISAQVALPATQSTVTSHSLAIIDLENQQALASYEVLANASGGLPAFLRLISSTAGGYAALAAPVVALMNTIVGGDPLVAMEARAGEVFFSRPIYIAVPGTSYHLIVGGGGVSGQQWLLWFGPNSTSAALATRTNGAMALGSDGVVYLGDAALGGSPKSATMPFSGNAGYSSGGVPQNIAGTTSPLTVPQSGKFVVDVSNVFVLSEGNGSSKLAIGSLALQIGKNGVYTTIASGISASTSNDIDPGAPVNASAMNLTVVHNFAGPVTFRVLAAGGGTSTQSRSVITGSLKATWYPT